MHIEFDFKANGRAYTHAVHREGMMHMVDYWCKKHDTSYKWLVFNRNCIVFEKESDYTLWAMTVQQEYSIASWKIVGKPCT